MYVALGNTGTSAFNLSSLGVTVHVDASKCAAPDAGTVAGADAGTVPVTTPVAAGCGCSSGGELAAFGLAAGLLAALRRRRA
jgi:MYXO-CTERM domain-containing protein